MLEKGRTKCDPGDPQAENITWAFVNNGTEIIIDGNRITIVELIKTRLRVSASVDTSKGEIPLTKQ